MPVSILIPAPLRRHVGGAKSVEVEATTAEAAMTALACVRPSFASSSTTRPGSCAASSASTSATRTCATSRASSPRSRFRTATS
jgi:hypothetical protein